ncbi:MAG: hypothetical protein GF411_05625 [Candidatus Lokiarchaeota archaeon]|nr:hypothetical protein [Candidatus Lokiarchaeota archaeon]
MFKNIVESYLITTKDKLIFEVKGVLHPSERIIAYLRYVPIDIGKNKASTTKYRKIVHLPERTAFLKKHYPEYIWYHKKTRRQYQSVPYEYIQAVHNPKTFLKHLRLKPSRNNTDEKIVQLTDLLVHVSGINYEDIGITGSHLVYLSNNESDIDLTIFGKEACLQFYNSIDKIFTYEDIQAYEDKALEQHVKFRWPKLERYQTKLQEIEKQKKLQGFFKDKEFFIRLVMNPEDIPYQFDDFEIISLGRIETTLQIQDHQKAIFTPTEYEIVPTEPEISKVISYRSRFCEQVRKGQYVKAYGRLERVLNLDNNITSYQLVLGESNEDYLIPIEK